MVWERRMAVDSKLYSEAVLRLRREGIRVTPQREAILDLLVNGPVDHPSADDLYQALAPEFPNLSVATIYNNLRLFTKIGLIKEMTYGDASSRFDFSSTQHYHAICQKCGRVVDLYYPILDDVEMVTENLTGFKVSGHRMEVYGICQQCQAKQEERV